MPSSVCLLSYCASIISMHFSRLFDEMWVHKETISNPLHLVKPLFFIPVQVALIRQQWAIILGRNKRRLIENYFRFWRHIPNKHRDWVFRRSSISCHDIVWKSDRFGRWIRRQNLHRILQKAFDDYYDVQQPFYSFFSSWEK